MKKNKFKEVSISFQPGNGIYIKTSEEKILVSTTKRIVHTNGCGESVIELSGLASEDAREDRSWAFAFYEQEGCSRLHYHQERTETYYVISGTATVIIEEKEHRINPGQEITIYPNQNHQVISSGKDRLEMIVKCFPAWIASDQYHIEGIARKGIF